MVDDLFSGQLHVCPRISAARHTSVSAFLAKARLLSGNGGTVLLLSDGKHSAGRHSFLCTTPLLIFSSKGDQILLETAQGKKKWRQPPMDALQELLNRFNLQPLASSANPPFFSGLTGYFAYELKNQFERLNQTANDDLNLPDIWLMMPGEVLWFDHQDNLERQIRINVQGLLPFQPNHQRHEPGDKGSEISSNLGEEKYLAAVETIRRHIQAGEVYQANLTQRLSTSINARPFDIFEAFFSSNPAPFFAFCNAGDHSVISSSMERFLRKQDQRLESRPIKGTRPRSQDEATDRRLQQELAENKKEAAELAMIVDLMRNDLSRICKAGSVSVEAHAEIESYTNVHHLVSTVCGELNKGIEFRDILRGTFPAGSISGCPKISALNIIDSLEPAVRHVYTGSIGYIGCNGDFDLSVAIRTAVVTGSYLHFGAGGGITWLSNPREEWQESLTKAQTLFEVINS